MVIDIKGFHAPKIFRGVLIAIVSLIVLMVVFQAGIFVGYHKATFSFGSGDNYYRAFGRGPIGVGRGMMGGFDPDDVPGGHGAVGKIVRINLPTIVVADIKNFEKTVFIDENTLIRRFRDNVEAENISVGETVIILGTPDEKGLITAKLIRILPPPPELIATTTIITASSSSK
jgi:hypothetical protein